MSDLKINNITDRTGDNGPVIAGVSTVTSIGAFTVPVGPTEMRGGRGRAVWTGGSNPFDATQDYVEIATLGNATDFGDTGGGARWGLGGLADATRGVYGGGYIPATFKTSLEYVTISSKGGSSDFGDFAGASYRPAGCNSSTRGLFGGKFGLSSWVQTNVIEFITIASTGNGSDFGDLQKGITNCGAVSSPTRGVFGGGENPVNLINYVTIATTGNAQDFGDLTVGRKEAYGSGSGVRGLFNGGMATPVRVNTIDYITIATLGNAADFGDTFPAISQASGAASSSVRSVRGGGSAPPSPYPNTNIIDYVTIASTGNAADFGDLTVARRDMACFSDANGGLG